MSDLRKKIIRLAAAKPHLQKHLLPLLKDASQKKVAFETNFERMVDRDLNGGRMTPAVEKGMAEFQKALYDALTVFFTNVKVDSDYGDWDMENARAQFKMQWRNLVLDSDIVGAVYSMIQTGSSLEYDKLLAKVWSRKYLKEMTRALNNNHKLQVAYNDLEFALEDASIDGDDW